MSPIRSQLRQFPPAAGVRLATPHVRTLWPLLFALCFSLAGSPGARAQGELHFARLGDFTLGSGQIIQDCRIAYRTFGELNAERSNAVLFPTSFSETSKDLAEHIGPGKLADSSKFFVIAVDALGNGISSSPSNSRRQPGARFPEFSIRDMVDSQLRLLREELNIERLHAVMGISMGGMQTFEWMVAYPDLMDRALPIVGSPKLDSYDSLLWRVELKAIEQALAAYSDPDSASNKARAAAMAMAADIHQLALTTPAQFNAEHPRKSLDAFLVIEEANLIRRVDPRDWASQLRAMLGQDVGKAHGGSLERAAAAVKAKVLIVVARQDHMVTPGPALSFAKMLGAETVVLEGPCGHLAFGCEQQRAQPAVDKFLGQ